MGNAKTTKTRFSRETTVSTTINASAETVWKLLTDAKGYTAWNSTITAMSGNIAKGGQVELKSILDDKRTFKLQVKEFEAPRRMVWGDRQGNREYLIKDLGAGKVTFSMTEKIGGAMFPLFARFIPDFDDVFNQFAADLKAAAEK